MVCAAIQSAKELLQFLTNWIRLHGRDGRIPEEELLQRFIERFIASIKLLKSFF
jgi:hypothetical protein